MPTRQPFQRLPTFTNALKIPDAVSVSKGPRVLSRHILGPEHPVSMATPQTVGVCCFVPQDMSVCVHVCVCVCERERGYVRVNRGPHYYSMDGWTGGNHLVVTIHFLVS